MKELCLSFHLIPILLVYDEHKLRYGLFTMYTIAIQYVSRVAMKTVRFHIAQMSLRIYFSHLVSPMRNCPGGC